jgi:hypothetical protein
MIHQCNLATSRIRNYWESCTSEQDLERTDPALACPRAGQRIPVISYTTRGQVALMDQPSAVVTQSPLRKSTQGHWDGTLV